MEEEKKTNEERKIPQKERRTFRAIGEVFYFRNRSVEVVAASPKYTPCAKCVFKAIPCFDEDFKRVVGTCIGKLREDKKDVYFITARRN